MDCLTLRNLFTDTFAGHWSAGVATSGIAPNTALARGVSQFFGRIVGAVGAKTSTVARGLQPLVACHDPRLSERARALGRTLARSAATGRRPRARGLRLSYFWIATLQRAFLLPMMAKNPGQFGAALEACRTPSSGAPGRCGCRLRATGWRGRDLHLRTWRLPGWGDLGRGR